jgi:hypothetical protein
MSGTGREASHVHPWCSVEPNALHLDLLIDKHRGIADQAVHLTRVDQMSHVRLMVAWYVQLVPMWKLAQHSVEVRNLGQVVQLCHIIKVTGMHKYITIGNACKKRVVSTMCIRDVNNTRNALLACIANTCNAML